MIKALNLRGGEKILVDGIAKTVAYRISENGGNERIVFTDGSQITVNFNRAFHVAPSVMDQRSTSPEQTNMSRKFEVIVGNVGIVYHGGSHRAAAEEFNAWVEESKEGLGRASNEPVTMLEGDDIIREYQPEE